ncbi:hypothetical protein PU560_00015, partial [Georgenia sp. 10Sc9-8]|nr:hypothetical protein [Georgenia halotolerans]
ATVTDSTGNQAVSEWVNTTVASGEPVVQKFGFFLNDGWDAWADHVFQYGRFSDEVLIGDWDNDSIDTITMRR